MGGSEVIARVLEAATFSIESLARETGISSATLYSWQSGRRNPSTGSLNKLAIALRRRGGELEKLADELERERAAEAGR